MHTTRTRLLLSAAATLLPLAFPAMAQAQDTPAADNADNEIIVTGTRAQNRTKLDSVAPVDVLTGDILRRQGSTELATALASVAPSIDFPRASAVDGTDAIRPATLRGLSPDQTLVLINGIRGHTSALLNVGGSVGRGSAAVDLNTIPSAALQQIEVLRDGASAQYGSDAIAGVVNLRLREASSGGGATVSYGFYDTDVNPALTKRHVTDGHTVTVSGWQGFKLGNGGFLTVSGEFMDRNPTNRSEVNTGATPNIVRARLGDPDVQQGTGYFNAALPVGDGWELFAFGGYQYRDSTSAAFPRLANDVNNVTAIYPDGFLPKINSRSKDLTITAGLRGQMGEWNSTIKFSYGRNKLDYHTQNSLNSTYGANSLTSFYSGGLTYDQFLGGMDLSRAFKLGGAEVNVAWGWEFRREGYGLTSGQPESYNRGPLGSNTALTSGAQGFIGLQADPTVHHRENAAAYLDLEAKLSDSFTLGGAVRGEHYSDFGDIATGKLSARWDVAPWIAFRGTASTGFRAPSLQQQYFTSRASVFSSGAIVDTGTFASTSPIAAALGGLPLRPEKSTNVSFGTVVRAGGFDLTVDAYWIRVRNQLGLSENIQASFSPQVAALLAPYSVGAARFFINGIRSTTKGIDVVAHYKVKTDSVGTFDLTAAGNFNDIKVNNVPTSTAVALTPTPTLFSRQRILTLEQGTPRTKIVGSIDWTLGDISATVRGTHYGDVTQPGTTAARDIHTGRKTVFDLEARYQFSPNLNVAFGANNVFDIYPNATAYSLSSSGTISYPFYSPFGFNGRYVYGRIGLSW